MSEFFGIGALELANLGPDPKIFPGKNGGPSCCMALDCGDRFCIGKNGVMLRFGSKMEFDRLLSTSIKANDLFFFDDDGGLELRDGCLDCLDWLTCEGAACDWLPCGVVAL